LYLHYTISDLISFFSSKFFEKRSTLQWWYSNAFQKSKPLPDFVATASSSLLNPVTTDHHCCFRSHQRIFLLSVSTILIGVPKLLKALCAELNISVADYKCCEPNTVCTCQLVRSNKFIGKSGFHRSSYSSLTTFSDIDECVSGRSVCPSTSTCRNVPGSYACDCIVGYTGYNKICNGESSISNVWSNDCRHVYTIGQKRSFWNVAFWPSKSHVLTTFRCPCITLLDNMDFLLTFKVYLSTWNLILFSEQSLLLCNSAAKLSFSHMLRVFQTWTNAQLRKEYVFRTRCARIRSAATSACALMDINKQA